MVAFIQIRVAFIGLAHALRNLRFKKSIILCVLSPAIASAAHKQLDWAGLFLPDRGQCEGLDLQIYASTITYDDCKKFKIRILTQSESDLAFEVTDIRRCRVSGAVFTLQRDESGNVILGKYDSLSSYRAQIPSYFCSYRR
jgi:hypothetical protein